MDANGLRYWMLADEQQWAPVENSPVLHYDRERRSLCLVSRRLLPPPTADDILDTPDQIAARLNRIPQTRDRFGSRAFWDAEARTIMATGAAPGVVSISPPEVDSPPTDLAMGYDGVLYIAHNGRVVMQDRRDRWRPVTLTAPNFTAWRLAADPSGGVWVLDRERRLARVQGIPFPDRPYGPYGPNTVRPCQENPTPPRLTVLEQGTWPADEQPVALACSPQGRLLLLVWITDDSARLRELRSDGSFAEPLTLKGVRFPYTMQWVDAERVAVLAVGYPAEALVYAVVAGPAELDPVGDFYPLREAVAEPFVQGVTFPPHYLSMTGTMPLHHLSLPSFAPAGSMGNLPLLDSGSRQTTWHRLYVEAAIPPNCGVTVWLAASDDDLTRPQDSEWSPHYFGECFAQRITKGFPRGAWVSHRSEVPFHQGVLTCAPEPHRTGLFTTLIQRANRPVRTLRGRYLWVRVSLSGDGRTTPEVAAVRAYASRFSYLDHYLPELYRESLFGPDADAAAPSRVATSTPSDFLERFLDNFEGILTPLEDRIANAYLLTDPRTTNEDAVEWLGSWIGVSFDPAYPPKQRRALIAAAPILYRQRGTLRGFKLALDLVTEGGVRGGEIVVLEDFRLRRTFATILGADLADEQDPLLAGITVSGNSYVGDTLFLGEETRKEFLALFAADLPKSAQEEVAVAAFLDRLAYRVTVLVHEEVEPQSLGLIRRIVELETPAHVQARVLTASQRFMVGIASLVGVDTYLGPPIEPQPVRVGQSHLSLRDLILRPPSLDPRFEGGDPNNS